MKTAMTTWAVVAVALASGCATVTPREMVDARNAYHRASDGPAQTYAPADLYEAGKVLDKAEAELESNGDSFRLRDLAYVALRKSEIAESRAQIAQDQEEIANAKVAASNVRDTQLTQTREELLNETQARSAADTALVQERDARRSAEYSLQKALDDLAHAAQVQVNEGSRGVVITISGSVLFATNKSDVLNNARRELNQVADALVAEPSDRLITIEGHTDSIGSADFNQTLSFARAVSVRDYLVSRGVPADRIDAKGYGASRPLVDNATAENRAMNRRVEIVIHPPPVSMR